MKKDNLGIKGDNSNEAFTPAELVKKHIDDPKHIISDEEMKNLIVGDEASDESEIKREIELLEEEEDVEDRQNNSYDIVDA